MRMFREVWLRDFLEARLINLHEEIQSAGKDYLLNANETKYVDYLLSRYRVDPLLISFDQQTISDREEMIAAERFPFDFGVEEGEEYPKQVITYHLPFSGDQELLRCKPSSWIDWTARVQTTKSEICFEEVNWRDDPAQIRSAADEIIRSIRTLYESVGREVAAFNDSLEAKIRAAIHDRKGALLGQSNLLAALGVPVQPSKSVPKTFAVPAITRNAVIKPQAPAATFAPEPTLDDSTYQGILTIIEDAGREMERHPSIYEDKDEEALRDFLIMVLSPHFQSVTGETFNKSGKTDILIRHERHNVFVAECKFWKGRKELHDAISQLLGYLTWRDSKTALVCFVRNKDFGRVLGEIESATPEHGCFVKYDGKRSESSLNYEFHLNADR